MEMSTPAAVPEQTSAANASGRKPRVALMGEFSAGKSTLSNMLLGADPLPVRVTATRLPPVWISYGNQAAYRVGLDGTRSLVDIEHLDQVELEETRMIRLFLESEALQLCDLIDMPGISDPNMSAQVWQNVMDEADSVVWCTHATQAWRQSEAATWAQIKDATSGDNLLLITQFDKLQSDRDKARVLARVNAETTGQFRAVYPISLTQALTAGDDSDQWEQSGASAFTEHLIDLLLTPSFRPGPVPEEVPDPVETRQPEAVVGSPEIPQKQEVTVQSIEPTPIRPKRVRRKLTERMRTRLPSSTVTTVSPVDMGAADGD